MINIPLNKLFVLDIETVPQHPSLQSLDTEWQDRWWHKIAKTIPEKITPEESYTMKAGILAEFGKIVCISTGYFLEKNGELIFKMKSVYSHNEKELLEAFLTITNKIAELKKDFCFAGHNIKEFDIPYICRRLLINQIPLPEYLHLHGAKPWEVKMIDTLQWWKFGDYKNYISLDLLAGVLGIPTSKTDMDGSMVQDVYYKENDLPRIADYCQRDIVVVANVILRYNNLPLLKEENIIVVP